MANSSRTISDARAILQSAQRDEAGEHKIGIYNIWAEDYDKDVDLLDFKAPRLAAECLSDSFEGDREKAVVLDVACGTGLVCAWLRKKGFQHFVGVDGSEKMLEVAKQKGLYQELKQSILGTKAMPVNAGTYDAVIVSGGLSFGNLPLSIVRELWQAAKPGGYVCMTTRDDKINKEYKNHLESVLSKMEKDGLWTQVSVMQVDDWEKASDQESESEYIPGAVYVYRKSDE